KDIHFQCLIASELGIRNLFEKHNDVSFYCVAIDDLNKENQLIPGIGDIGERIYGAI
ncbi:MAG: uracil phosphoribosyltransferase, partial [Silvanigrellaceae bacterium]|nr:uracil phosphoribosyltransferase [Silvanigrellaceae bacterium]